VPSSLHYQNHLALPTTLVSSLLHQLHHWIVLAFFRAPAPPVECERTRQRNSQENGTKSLTGPQSAADDLCFSHSTRQPPECQGIGQEGLL